MRRAPKEEGCQRHEVSSDANFENFPPEPFGIPQLQQCQRPQQHLGQEAVVSKDHANNGTV